MKRTDIFNFNHLEKKRDEAKIKKSKEFYKYYHKKAWYFKKSFKKARFLDHSIEFSGIFLFFVGTVTGGITLNPIILEF